LPCIFHATGQLRRKLPVRLEQLDIRHGLGRSPRDRALYFTSTRACDLIAAVLMEDQSGCITHHFDQSIPASHKVSSAWSLLAGEDFVLNE
jgi:hypothetical protein